MTWSYSGDPSSNAKDAMRFLLGDTTERMPLLQDEELLACLKASNDNAAQACVLACRGLIAKLARLRDENVGSVSISFSQQYDHYMQLMGSLMGDIGISGSFEVYAGGTSRRDSWQITHDPDRIPPDFRRRRPAQLGTALGVGPGYIQGEWSEDLDYP